MVKKTLLVHRTKGKVWCYVVSTVKDRKAVFLGRNRQCDSNWPMCPIGKIIDKEGSHMGPVPSIVVSYAHEVHICCY